MSEFYFIDRLEAVPEAIERICLKCRKAFIAESRFNRLCDRCNRDNKRVGERLGRLDRHAKGEEESRESR
jgi:hypothetical protein